MSITSRTGDSGTTALMYGRRVSKCHARVEACGAVDELNAALGLARASAAAAADADLLRSVQADLVGLMGELATAVEDLPRYVREGRPRIRPEQTGRLDRSLEALQAAGAAPKGWARPGATPYAAALDLARAVCRRAERRVCALQDAGQLQNPQLIVYLNRLSDLLWLLARRAEAGGG
jgi:cob(I)alamin adenosyltransferase